MSKLHIRLAYWFTLIALFVSISHAAGKLDFFGARAYGGRAPAAYLMLPGDFDGDGNLDALRQDDHNTTVTFANPGGTFAAEPYLIYGDQISFVVPAAGDFDGDGRADVILERTNPTNLKYGIAFYKGQPGRTFGSPVFSDLDLRLAAAHTGDFDGDGKLDFIGIVSTYDINALYFCKGNGDGTFAGAVRILPGFAARLVRAADFDGDGLQDIAFLSGGLKVARNLGNGNFASPITILNDDFGISMLITGDINNDGKDDLVGIEGYSLDPSITVWTAGPNFTFTNSYNSTIESNDYVYADTLVDLDKNHSLDLVCTSLNRTIIVRGNGDGTFADEESLFDGGRGAFAADVDNDGLIDIVSGQSAEFTPMGSGTLAVIKNLGNDLYESAPALRLGSGTKDVAIAYLNNDDLPDIAVVNHGSGGGPGEIFVVFQSAAANVSEKFLSRGDRGALALSSDGVDASSVAAGDFNRDGRTDLIVAGHGAYGDVRNTLLLTNTGGNNFAATQFQVGSGDIYRVAAADLNSDGKLDLITTGYQGIYVSYGAGNGTFAAATQYLPNVASSSVAIGDVNGDSRPDIVAVNYNINKVSLLLANSSGGFTAAANPIAVPNCFDLSVVDFDLDGRFDIVAAVSDGVSVFRGNGDGTFNSARAFPLAQTAATRIKVADLNGDSLPDVAALTGRNSVAVLLNDGAGGLGNETIWGAGVETQALAAGDLNGDNRNDLVVGFTTEYATYKDGYIKLLFNQTSPQVNVPKAPFDFDGDGKTDVSVFRPSSGQWWIQKSGDNQSLAAAFGSSTDVATPADYTGDGKTDMAFFRPSTGTWFILRSEDFSFYGFPFGSSTDIPAPADFDGDGKADPAVFRNGAWFILRSTDGGVRIEPFGVAGDKPVPADFDADGKADLAIYRPNGGTGGEWWVNRSTAGLFAASFGSAEDKAAVGDYTGDGKADCAFFRPSTGTWYVLRSEDQSFFGFPFGSSTDAPAPGDYDGDGKTDAAVFRQPGSQWFVNKSTGGVLSLGFGAAGDQPVPGSYVR